MLVGLVSGQFIFGSGAFCDLILCVGAYVAIMNLNFGQPYSNVLVEWIWPLQRIVFVLKFNSISFRFIQFECYLCFDLAVVVIAEIGLAPFLVSSPFLVALISIWKSIKSEFNNIEDDEKTLYELYILFHLFKFYSWLELSLLHSFSIYAAKSGFVDLRCVHWWRRRNQTVCLFTLSLLIFGEIDEMCAMKISVIASRWRETRINKHFNIFNIQTFEFQKSVCRMLLLLFSRRYFFNRKEFPKSVCFSFFYTLSFFQSSTRLSLPSPTLLLVLLCGDAYT